MYSCQQTYTIFCCVFNTAATAQLTLLGHPPNDGRQPRVSGLLNAL